ncbi:MAG TPA: 4-carboxy-4-hydroxy-2-oxoadipate aldolase/oxaloacetate decarboxylase [Bryobacteraceae bacterium]|nr:4-carboxy-4-hydroxy-2-oxoadipate aldolase/oxaloacetate decarboxylase [Bryobacteraceae bacterium]
MSHKIVRKIARPDAGMVKVLGTAGVATVHEAQGRTGLMRPYMRPIYPAARLAGPAVTISIAPGDNLMIHASIEVCKPGDVLVVAPTSECTDGYFGELLGVSCQAHGIAGLIIDAGVRDTAELTELKFPVWSKAVSSQGTVKNVPGDVNVPVVCAGAMVNPGDVIIADADGVVVVPREAAADVAKASEARIAKEEKTRERLRKGELGLDFYGLRAKLAELGVEFVDEAESKSIGSSK